MHDLALGPVGRGKVGQMLQPAMADRGLEYLAQSHDLVVKGASRRWFIFERAVALRLGIGLKPRGHAMDPVFLHLAGGDLGDAEFAEKGIKVQADADTMALDPAGTALALGDDLIFALELHSGFAKVKRGSS